MGNQFLRCQICPTIFPGPVRHVPLLSAHPQAHTCILCGEAPDCGGWRSEDSKVAPGRCVEGDAVTKYRFALREQEYARKTLNPEP